MSVGEFQRRLHGSNWQRLQAVRAVEAYRDLMLRTGEPSLGEIRQAVQRLELRVRRKALDTERAYKSFLTQLAVEGNVAPNTQNQAKSALLFLYQQVFQRELAFLDAVSADKAKRLPVVLSRDQIARVWPQFTGLRCLMFLVMYGTGLRHRECRRLRIKDICLDEGHIVVRTGRTKSGSSDGSGCFPHERYPAIRAAASGGVIM